MLKDRHGRLEANQNVCLLHLTLCVFDSLTLCLKQLSQRSMHLPVGKVDIKRSFTETYSNQVYL